MSNVTVLKMLLKVNSPEYGFFLKRMNVKQDLGQLMSFVRSEFPDATPYPPNQVRIKDEFYNVSLNSKGILLRLIEEPTARNLNQIYRSQGPGILKTFGIPEHVELTPYDSGHLIKLSPATATELRWAKRSAQLDVLANLLPALYPDFAFGNLSAQRITFSSGGADYRCSFLSGGIYILRPRSYVAMNDDAIGTFNFMEDAIKASLVRLGDNAGFLGLYSSLPGEPKRNCYYAAFEVDDHYYRGIVNGKTKIYGLEPSEKLIKFGLVSPGQFYLSVNYGDHLQFSPEEIERIFKANRKAGRIIPLEELL